MERPLTQTIGDGAPLDLRGYRRAGGYRALEKAVRDMTPAQVIDEIDRSRLRGRGGAGFPTGKKWSFVPAGVHAPTPKYMVVNADEMEPGTFKDRYLIEGAPHQLLEGAIIAAYAVGADRVFLFLRWAYRRVCGCMRRAVDDAYAAGYLGKNILGSGLDIDLDFHVSAGRYMCGEETGLLNALEGKRATPRAKPPYPQACGLWGKPTVVNNVETLCNVPHIIARGADWFRGLSHSDDGGTKIYGVSGRVRRPGLWELPIGTPLGEILDEHAGGMLPGYEFRAVLPGGASTNFLGPEHMDVSLDFNRVQAAGSRLGTGTIVVLDDRTCPVGLLLNLESFFARESCGWCTPCREGLPWVARVVEAIEDGRGQPEDLDLLAEHTAMLGPGNTFCALAPGAMEPLGSALHYFGDDFRRHITERRCPWRSG